MAVSTKQLYLINRVLIWSFGELAVDKHMQIFNYICKVTAVGLAVLFC